MSTHYLESLRVAAYYKVSGGAINEEIREQTTPPDEADVERALVLASRK